MKKEVFKVTLREGNYDIRCTESGKAIMSGYVLSDLAVVYNEMKEVLGDKITMAERCRSIEGESYYKYFN
jgi:hypothetical protein